MNTKGSQVYQELGGDAAIEILAEKLNERVLADPIFEDHFKDMSRRVLEKHPKEYLKVALGGPTIYNNDAELRKTHQHEKIYDEQFTALQKHYVALLQEMQVSQAVIDGGFINIENWRNSVLKR